MIVSKPTIICSLTMTATTTSDRQISRSIYWPRILVLFPFLVFVLVLSAWEDKADASNPQGVENSHESFSVGRVEHEKVEGDDVGGNHKTLTTGVDHLRTAVESEDLCLLYKAIRRVDLGMDDWSQVRQLIGSIAESMIDAEGFVPEELNESWAELIRGMDRIASQIDEDPTDRGKIWMASQDPKLIEADRVVGEWAKMNCEY